MSNQLKELIKVSLLYSNPQNTDRARKKGKTGKALIRSMWSQYLLAGVTFLVIYGVTMVGIDFTQYPGIFTSYVGIFCLLGISQAVSIIYNVFFESKDLAAYLPLPFKQSQIFVAKSAVVTLSVVPYLLPLLALFILTGLKAGNNLILVIIFSLLAFFLVVLSAFAVASIIVFGITRTKIFKAHKKMMTTLMLWVTLGIAVVGILLMNNREYYPEGEKMPDSFVNPLFKPLHSFSVDPISVNGLLGFAATLLVAVALVVIIRLWLVPRLYEQLTEASSDTGSNKRRHKEYQGLRKLLLRYNFELVKNPNLITQVLSTSIVFPLVMVGSMALQGGMDMGQLGLHYLGVFFVAGFVVAIMTTNQISFIGNLISLDGENYDFIRSLPISRKAYLKEKFILGYLVQAALSGITALLCGLFLRANLLLVLALVIGSMLGTLICSLLYFERDYRLLMTDWTNLNQLFTRGAGRFGSAFVMLGSWLFGGIAIAAYALVTGSTDSSWPNVIALSLVLIGSGVIIWVNKSNFWDKLDEVSWQRKISINKTTNK